MFKKLLLLMILSMALLFVPSQWAAAQGPDTEHASGKTKKVKVERTVEITNIDLQEDANWPIIRQEVKQLVNAASGETETYILTIRQSPAGYQPSAEQGALDCSTTDGMVTIQSTCNYQGSHSIHAQHLVAGVTSNIKHFADRYCRNNDCNDEFFKPTRVQVWWNRWDADRSAKNAVVTWGCGGCNVCGGGSTTNVWRSNPFNPGWQDNFTSFTYTYTSTTWPIMQGTIFQPVGAVIDADAFRLGSKQGHMTATANLPY